MRENECTRACGRVFLWADLRENECARMAACMNLCGGADAYVLILRQSALGGPLAVPVRHRLVLACSVEVHVGCMYEIPLIKLAKSLSFGERERHASGSF